MLECRNAPDSPLPDAPDTMPAYVALSVELLGVIRLERGMDAEEWECIERL